MRLTVLGSGDAFSGCGCNAGYLLDATVLVDCGAPVHVLMHRRSQPIEGVRLILLTHYHADHSFMLPLVLGALAFRPEPRTGLVVAGPLGIREFVYRILADGYGHSIQELVADKLQPVYAELQDGSDADLAGYRIRAHAVVHSTGTPSGRSLSTRAMRR